MAKFVDLPREIRDQIYDHCLVVKGEIMTYDEVYHVPRNQRARPPGLALTAVCKMIRTEALTTLYGKNVWRIGSEALSIHGKDHPWWSYYDLFRHVVLYFNRFDKFRDEAYKVLELYPPLGPGHGLDELRRRTSYAHYRNSDLAVEIMHNKRHSLEILTDLSTVVFDVEKLLCFDACCRFECLESMLETFLTENEWDMDVSLFYAGIHVTVRGIWNEEEVRLVRKMAPFVKIEMRNDGEATQS